MKHRRRSATVAFSVIGLSAALAGCDDPPAPKVYESVKDCATEHGAQACDSAWQASVGEHQATAPQYSQREQCEAQYGPGHCEPYAGRQGSVFIPLMAGFMIGRALNRPDQQNQPGYPYGGGGGGGYVGHPVFFNRSGGYQAGSARPGEALFTRGAGFTERAGFGRAGGFSFGFRGG